MSKESKFKVTSDLVPRLDSFKARILIHCILKHNNFAGTMMADPAVNGVLLPKLSMLKPMSCMRTHILQKDLTNFDTRLELGRSAEL